MFGKKKKEDNESTSIDTSKVAENNIETATTFGQEAQAAPIVLSNKEMKSLISSKYEQKAPLYKKSFVIKNKRTGMIVELRAVSAVHAANFIGWKPRHTVLIKEKDITDEIEAQAKIDDANAEIDSRKENSPALN